MFERKTNELTEEHFGTKRPDEADSYKRGEQEKTDIQQEKLRQDHKRPADREEKQVKLDDEKYRDSPERED